MAKTRRNLCSKRTQRSLPSSGNWELEPLEEKCRTNLLSSIKLNLHDKEKYAPGVFRRRRARSSPPLRPPAPRPLRSPSCPFRCPGYRLVERVRSILLLGGRECMQSRARPAYKCMGRWYDFSRIPLRYLLQLLFGLCLGMLWRV